MQTAPADLARVQKRSALGWPCIEAARCRVVARAGVFASSPEGRPIVVGSIAREHCAVLARWPRLLALEGDSVRFLPTGEALTEQLRNVNAALHAEHLIPGWRDEAFSLFDPITLRPLAAIERAAARFWGLLTVGAHANGYIADARGRPTHLWVARRSLTKTTDPGKLDNLIGGGVPHGQSPWDTLVREGWEEAGLGRALSSRAQPGSVIHLFRDIPEGLQHEHLHAYDLPLPLGFVPTNQDGEVAELRLCGVQEALELVATDEMTVDAALVTLDFALRHQLLAPAKSDALHRRMRALCVGRAKPRNDGPAVSSAKSFKECEVPGQAL